MHEAGGNIRAFKIFGQVLNHLNHPTSVSPPHFQGSSQNHLTSPRNNRGGFETTSPHLEKSRLFQNSLTSPQKNRGDFQTTSPHLKKIEVVSNNLTSPQKNRGDFQTTSPHLRKIEVVSKQPHPSR
jgi:hypothetical protein